jgi:hypothetical protein
VDLKKLIGGLFKQEEQMNPLPPFTDARNVAILGETIDRYTLPGLNYKSFYNLPLNIE